MHVRSGMMGAVILVFVASGVSADTARIVSVTGSAQRQQNDAARWVPLRAGDTLAAGSVLKTLPRSRARVTLADGSSILLYPNSHMTVSDASARSPLLKMAAGKLKAWISHAKKRTKFEVKTPVAVCSVRGTEFTVAVEPSGETDVEVLKGLLGVRAIDGTGEEVPLGAGERLSVAADKPLTGELKSVIFGGVKDARYEVGLSMDKNEVQAAAAYEMRLAEYQEGKTMVDVFGKRVRLEEYVMRSAPDTFKLVVLNERDARFDYFYYQGTFNKTLPDDLRVALNGLSGRLGTTAPEYFLTGYEQVFSNTRDYVKDTGAGGHLVKITYNADGTFTLTDPDNPSTTRTVNAWDADHGAYDPVTDTFDAGRTSAYDLFVYAPADDSFQSFTAGQTLWRTRFNNYEHVINGVRKQWYLPANPAANMLVSDLDGHWLYPSLDSYGNTIYGEWGTASSEATTPDAGYLHNRLHLTYYDNTFEQYDTYIISDDGSLAATSAFAGITTGAAYKQELLKWNYQQVITATEFQGRTIDLVVEPKILIKSGIIQ